MSHSYYNLLIHAVFRTKDKSTLLKDEFRLKIYEYMKNILSESGCKVKILNGVEDHLHILFSQNPNVAVSETIKNLKGNSSHWINQQGFFKYKFSWQIGYAVFSVSQSQSDKVFKYIYNQNEHHKSLTFNEELNGFLELNGIFADGLDKNG